MNARWARDLLLKRIELYRNTLRTGVTGKVAIEYLRQIESDEAELFQIRHRKDTELNARGLAVDSRPPRPLRKFLAELIEQFDALAVTDKRRATDARRIRRVEVEIARRRHPPFRLDQNHGPRDRGPTHARQPPKSGPSRPDEDKKKSTRDGKEPAKE